MSIKGRYDGALFKNSSKPQVLTPKRRVTRERNEDLITVRLYRRDLIELLDDPNTEDEVYLCEGELDLSALTNKINPARLSEIQADRLNAYYLDKFPTEDIDKFAFWVEMQAVMSEDRRTQQGKPSLPDMAVYTSLYDALGFGPYNLPLVDGNTRYDQIKAIFPDSFAHLGIGKPLTAKHSRKVYSLCMTTYQNYRSDFENWNALWKEFIAAIDCLY